jgi:Spy/CpxP family protein refolding chaperone
MTPTPRNQLLSFLSIFLAALAGGALGCLLCLKWMGDTPNGAGKGGRDWLHGQLRLTEAQEPAIAELEQKFEARETELKAALAAANRQLGAIIKEEQSFTPRVSEAVEETHMAMAELQKAGLERVFAMKDRLTPEQYSRLLELAGDALGD